MKKILTLIIGICIACSVFGQQKLSSVFQHVKAKSVIPTAAQSSFRTAGSTKQRLDSIVSEDAWYYKYNYDGSNNMTLEVDYVWDATTSKWLLDSKTEYAYDAKGNTTLEAFYDWDVSAWKGSYKTDYTYDANNNNTVEIRSIWNTSTKDWIVNYKVEYTIANTLITQSLSYSWSGTMWIQSGKSDYTYNTGKQNIQVVDLYWNGTIWVESNKRNFSYDANNNQTLGIYYSKDGSVWIESAKTEQVYDAKNNMTEETYYQWDDAEEQWVGEDKFEYSYDDAVSATDLILPAYVEEYFRHKIIMYKEYSYDGEWALTDNAIFYYSGQVVSGITPVSAIENGITLYPNPSSGVIKINNTKSGSQMVVDLYDGSGKHAMSKTISNNESVSFESLQKGIYFYRIAVDQSSYNGTLVLE